MIQLRNVMQRHTRAGVARRTLLACMGLALAGLFFVLSLQLSPEPKRSTELLSEARAALRARDFHLAERVAAEIPKDDEIWSAAMLVAGEAATKAGRLKAAAAHYGSVPLTAERDSVLAHFSFGEVLLHAGELTQAEHAYREVLQIEPGYVEAASRLAFLLGATGRRRESGPMLFAILKSGSATLEELVFLADLERPQTQPEFLMKCQQQQPDDLMLRLGLAYDSAVDGRADDAIAALQPIVRERPDLMAAQCLLGELLIESTPGEFEKWHRKLPTKSAQWPDLWFVRGRWAEKVNQPQVAARCFVEALRTVSMFRRANYQLGITLTRLKIPDAEKFSIRSATLLELSTWLTHAQMSNGTNETAMRSVVEILTELGRTWEACAWSSFCRTNFPNAKWRTTTLSRLGPKLNDDLPLVPPDQDLTHLVDVSTFPAFRLVSSSKSVATTTTAATTARIEFEDAGARFNFVYNNGFDKTTPGARIQEQTGGGVAVLDFDGDTWPDLYLVQGSDWIHRRPQAEIRDNYFDRIFRNRCGVEYEDITLQVGIREYGFGQGAAAGDVDDDGFPDLYVANVGSNSLYLNNGDGTFQKQASVDTASDSVTFTSSVAIADIDGDGFSDLFDANYVTGDEVYHRICSGRACSPSAFDGQLDELHLNSGDGHFSTMAAATPAKDAKGLGLVVVGIGDALRPFVFVANDQTPNFLLQYSGSSPDESPRLSDTGFGSGVAYSKDGLVTAAMGIAADDVDHNGLIDFFVTNFADESNCLYLQTSRGFFTDTARSAGLRAPSFPYVSWGTQFIDADLNGELDLVVTNGHVDSYGHGDGQPEMQSQFFRNLGDAKFTELPAREAGEYFARKYFGRALAILDWNQDGLTDFVMIPIRDEAALISNTTFAPGHFINVKLHATKSARDAFFSIVELTAGEHTWTKQLIAGNGYHACNERVLQFGLGQAGDTGEMIVSWPSGSKSRISQLPVDATIELVEGATFATAWNQGEATTIAVTCD